MEMWEILVPQAFNDGARVSDLYHQQWDEKVRQIAGGLTILRSATGIWTSPDGAVFREGMIPVRVVCSEEQMRLIVDMTFKHYEQKAVMFGQVSSRFFIEHKDT